MSGFQEVIPGQLSELLLRAAELFPQQEVGFVRPDHSIKFTTYPGILDHARRLLAGLRQCGIAQGDKVILSLDTSEEIIPALWACFLGGIVPALLQPPVSFSEYNPAAEKAEKVFRLLGDPKVILSHLQYNSWLNSGIPAGSLIDLATVPTDHAGIMITETSPGDPALLQFSSGSTGDPKGVMLTQRNILHNIHDISRGLKLMPHDVSVSWMPLFHDMGLMGFHMTATYTGCFQYFIEPADFIKNPLLWLDILSEKRATITGCPNFGQVLINRAVGRKRNPDWNFSSLRAVFNGAEPISVASMEEFNANLQPYRYDPVAMLPAYGMAEATLAVTFSPLEEPACVTSFVRNELLGSGNAVETSGHGPETIRLVNLGRPLPHCEIRIADEHGNTLPGDRTGHVLVRGENVTTGYFNNPEETAAALQAGWLHTGDLGFIHNDDLYIMGRIKDIIFINGINYYAHDLETVALRAEGVSYGRIVMAGYFDEAEGRDKVIAFIVAADNEATHGLFRSVQQHFLKTIALMIDTFVPVRSNDIPRTSSGKVQRYKMVNRFLRGEFPVVVKL
jgi:acyl-CoA synthetase (AMP-forming)/AMP-acid ligase II